MIYFIQSTNGGPIKIGYAANPQKRLAEIQRMSPVALRMLAVINGDRKEEDSLHRQFSTLRLYGEWFEPSDSIFSFIDGIPKPETTREESPLLESEQVTELPKPSKPLPPEFRNLPFLLDTDAVSRLLGLTRAGVIKMFERGDLPGFKLGRLWRIHRPNLLKALGF